MADSAALGRFGRLYLRFLAIVLGFGALVHVGNIMGAGGTAWRETPLLFRVMDVVLLAFDVVVGVGLWLRARWSVPSFVAGMVLLQLVPYTLFRGHFATTDADRASLQGLVLTELVLLAVLGALVIGKR